MRAAWLLGVSVLAFGQCPATAQDKPAHPPAAPSHATPASDNVLLTAEDAFGERIGIEQVGLYSESQSRGFSLANTGAYRIDGAYFSPTNGLIEPLIGGVSIRLGVNAARLDFPSPSGVVNYRLRTAPPGNRLSFTTGDRHYGSLFAELNGSAVSSDGKLGITGGIFAQPNTNRPDGGEGSLYYAGLSPFWQPSSNLRVRGLVGYRETDFQGNYVFAVNADALESSPRARTFYAPQWSRSKAADGLIGTIIDYAPSSNWRITGSTFYAESRPDFSDFTVLTVRPDGDASVNQIRTPDRKLTSLSSELRATTRFDTGKISHSVGLGLRNRASRTRIATGTPFNLGVIDLEDPEFVDEPAYVDNGARTKDAVDQLTGSINYSALIGGKLELRAGLHLTRYEKTITPPMGAPSAREEDRWLYNLSGVYLLDAKTTLFASYVRGLEEAGVAPQNAVNRGEVLSPVLAEQFELGLRRTLIPNLTLIGAVFDISKPTPGLRSDGVYAFVGEVRHRGAEVSLNGRLGSTTTIVAGAVLMKPSLSGELVKLGRVGPRPAGIPPTIAFISIDQKLPLNGMSIDGRVSYVESRPANILNTLETPGYMTTDLGGRYSFALGKSQATLRATIVNVFDEREWAAGAGGTMVQTSPRFVRLSLTLPFV